MKAKLIDALEIMVMIHASAWYICVDPHCRGGKMNEGTLFATFVIVFRECVEAGLILGIILTMLSRLKQQYYYRHVIAGSVAGVGASVFAGVTLPGESSTSNAHSPHYR
ncbi:MAG: hypothetical protein GF398_01555 [Chitinivibrionales bacterium]|nr:hypothetical protein [Chitinivibrionales bacterium]